ncbi:MAG TPA: antitoxin family protein [Leptolyngbyaceae cyanobacterium]
MSEIMVAVYENGVLRPLNPVSFNEGQTVRLQVIPDVDSEDSKNESETTIQSLANQGKITLSPKRGQVDIEELSRRHRNRKLIKIEGKPLSETIIEDRGQW